MKTNLRAEFLLNPDITFLNFGSFGACPSTIFEDYQAWQRVLEYEPVQFMIQKGLQYLKDSRIALSNYVHCKADDLVFVPNPSYAVNILAKSFPLQAGDEVLTTNLEYGACDKTWNYYCKKTGAKYVRQPIDLPIVSKEIFIEQFFAGLTPNTKAIFISHITSSTGLIFPVKEICAIAKEKGLFTIVDGAHIPGHIPLDLSDLQADAYTGACHKWMMTPKGCSFLYVKKEHQHLFDPLVVSWGYDSANPSHSQFLDYHQMQGTRDFSAFLTVPKALEFMAAHNWAEVAAECRALVQANAMRFCELLGATPLAPINDEFIGQLYSIPISTTQPEALQQHLYHHYHIEIPVMRHEQQVFIRYSINAFNSQADLDHLYHALTELLAAGELCQKW